MIDAGRLPLPEGCRSEVRVSIKVPAAAPVLPTKGKVKAGPSISLIYSRNEAQGSALEALAHVVELTRQQGPGCKLVRQDELTFTDGRAGVSAVLSLQVDAQTSLHQKHFARVDDGVLTHFVLTGPSQSFEKTDREWSARIKDFSLNA